MMMTALMILTMILSEAREEPRPLETNSLALSQGYGQTFLSTITHSLHRRLSPQPSPNLNLLRFWPSDHQLTEAV